jgi:hypothetical protein
MHVSCLISFNATMCTLVSIIGCHLHVQLNLFLVYLIYVSLLCIQSHDTLFYRLHGGSQFMRHHSQDTNCGDSVGKGLKKKNTFNHKNSSRKHLKDV